MLNTKGYRAIGHALKMNKHPLEIPCHRVINSDGTIGGYNLGVAKKIRLLRSEGIEIKGGAVIDFKKHLWHF